MPLFQSWTDNIRRKKLAARKIQVSELGWTLQLPLNVTPERLEKAQKSYETSVNMMGLPSPNSIYHTGNVKVLFSAYADRYNHLSGSLSSIRGFSPDQLQFSREDCKDRLLRLFSRAPQSQVERSSSTCTIGKIIFEQHSFLITRNKKPILCMEYIFQNIGEFELALSMTYNNESHRQTMFKCLEESRFE